jgi:hypothetical protein
MEVELSTMEAELFDAFRSIGVTDDRASADAQGLSRSGADMRAATSDIREELLRQKRDIIAVKGDLTLLKWMVGSVVAMTLPILLKLFLR